ncbi:MAG: hypothetical protein JO069_10720, partial [Verrucomicrobia bacterium]|nr:hypothetical protein [Verrucomicrobiota bacterium]
MAVWPDLRRSNPDLQLAGGCLVDQLVGQFLAHVCGLGYLANPRNINNHARAMASWAAILALTGFQYSGVTETMTFTATSNRSRTFWTNGYASGTILQVPDEDGI